MTNTEIEELKRLAESAHEGRWIACGPSFGKNKPKFLNEVMGEDDACDDGICICYAPEMWESDPESSANIDFIAAANPQAILSLIAELEQCKKDADRYRWLRDKSEPGICTFYLSVGKAFHEIKFLPETVYLAIDFAMKRECEL